MMNLIDNKQIVNIKYNICEKVQSLRKPRVLDFIYLKKNYIYKICWSTKLFDLENANGSMFSKVKIKGIDCPKETLNT